MDLTKGVPRSPYEELGGMVFLPRAIDKMRAHLAGTKGEYNSHAGTSGRMCRLLFGISADEFERIVREHTTDDGVLAVLHQRAPPTAEQIEDWNEHALNDGPTTAAEWAEHWQRLDPRGHRRPPVPVRSAAPAGGLRDARPRGARRRAGAPRDRPRHRPAVRLPLHRRD